jgi:hypothetical protein
MLPREARAYATVLLVALLSRVLLEFTTADYVTAGQRVALSWRFFALFVGSYGVAVALASRAMLAGPHETLAHARVALRWPIAVGAAVGLATIASDMAAAVAASRGLDTVHVRGWAALPFYAYGAVLLTTVFHFLPVAAAAWLARRLTGRGRVLVLGIGIAVAAFSEDMGYFLNRGAQPGIEWARHALSVAANALEATFIYRHGLLAGLAQRSTTYLLWHLLWPAFGRPDAAPACGYAAGSRDMG